MFRGTKTNTSTSNVKPNLDEEIVRKGKAIHREVAWSSWNTTSEGQLLTLGIYFEASGFYSIQQSSTLSVKCAPQEVIRVITEVVK